MQFCYSVLFRLNIGMQGYRFILPAKFDRTQNPTIVSAKIVKGRQFCCNIMQKMSPDSISYLGCISLTGPILNGKMVQQTKLFKTNFPLT